MLLRICSSTPSGSVSVDVCVSLSTWDELMGGLPAAPLSASAEIPLQLVGTGKMERAVGSL